MKALREIFLAPFRRRTVEKFTVAGTYSITLAAGRYHVVVVGPGGGAAAAGWTFEADAASATGNWIYATGGGGGMCEGDFTLASPSTFNVVVGSGGSGQSDIRDVAPTSMYVARGTEGGNSQFSLAGDAPAIFVDCRSGGGAYAEIRAAGGSKKVGGVGGVCVSGLEGSANAKGNDGAAAESVVTMVADGTSYTASGGLAGGGRVPEALGDAGRGGSVAWGYSAGTLTFSGGDGNDGAVLVERIG